MDKPVKVGLAAGALLTAEGPLDDAPAGHFYKVVSSARAN